jgi:ribonuclease P protein component
VKRCVREWFRRRRELVPAGIDLVVIARPAAVALARQEAEQELGATLDRLLRADRSK